MQTATAGSSSGSFTELEDDGGGRGVQYGVGEAAARAGPAGDRARGLLAAFRGELYRCLGRRADALFELADAVLCRQERVHMLAELSLEPECRRGHGAVYDALNCGEVQVARLRRALAAPAAAGLGRRADPAGGGCEQLAAAGRGDQPGAAVLPLLCAGQGERADDPGLAVLAGRGAGAGPHVVDAAAGRGPARPGR